VHVHTGLHDNAEISIAGRLPMRTSTAIVCLTSTLVLAACEQRDQAGNAQRTAAASAPKACADLAALSIANTSIASAQAVAAGAFESPVPGFQNLPGADYTKLPSFCRVAGSIAPSADSDIRFEIWLPEQNWNGKFMQTGNGGAAGSIVYSSLADPLARGYAVANTDTGHQGGIGDFAWAAAHPERLTDYQYRAVHELTVVGKAVTSARYGRDPEKSYWVGCSTGGRQGLKEAQRFPDDYDAIVAGAPANNWSALMAFSIHAQRNMTTPDGLPASKVGILKEAAIAACDAHDGVKDRVIGDTRSCAFDPASTQCAAGQTEHCLTAAEVAAAKRIYAGVVTKAGEVLIPGTGPGSEPLWAAYSSPQFSIGSNYFRNVVARDPSWDPASFDADTDVARAEAHDAGAAKAMDPDLSAFLESGGKLVLYHGTTDGLIPYRNTVNYYESVVQKLGADAVRDRVALYLVPGMDHCAGGEGASAIDWIDTLERFDASGKPPSSIAARHPAVPSGIPGAPAAPAKPFTRPVCLYPQIAKYRGSGDEADAASWECAVP
jgi:feruloyl esterase